MLFHQAAFSIYVFSWVRDPSLISSSKPITSSQFMWHIFSTTYPSGAESFCHPLCLHAWNAVANDFVSCLLFFVYVLLWVYGDVYPHGDIWTIKTWLHSQTFLCLTKICSLYFQSTKLDYVFSLLCIRFGHVDSVELWLGNMDRSDKWHFQACSENPPCRVPCSCFLLVIGWMGRTLRYEEMKGPQNRRSLGPWITAQKAAPWVPGWNVPEGEINFYCIIPLRFQFVCYSSWHVP